jgi:Uncharacterised MFS-type transporter YbfB
MATCPPRTRARTEISQTDSDRPSNTAKTGCRRVVIALDDSCSQNVSLPLIAGRLYVRTECGDGTVMQRSNALVVIRSERPRVIFPAIIGAHLFAPSDAAYLGAANLAAYLAGALLGRPLAARRPAPMLLRALMLLATVAFFACALLPHDVHSMTVNKGDSHESADGYHIPRPTG